MAGPTAPPRGRGDSPQWTRHEQVIRLRLGAPRDMFEVSQADMFSEYRNFLTGVDYCISVLRSRRSRTSARIVLELPESETDAMTAERISRTLRRYCDHRIEYNDRERRVIRLDGLSALWVGIPVAALGFLLAYFIPHWLKASADTVSLADTAGWVLAWVGLWYPLDTIFFGPLGYAHENRVLTVLGRASIEIEPIVLPASL